MLWFSDGQVDVLRSCASHAPARSRTSPWLCLSGTVDDDDNNRNATKWVCPGFVKSLQTPRDEVKLTPDNFPTQAKTRLEWATRPVWYSAVVIQDHFLPIQSSVGFSLSLSFEKCLIYAWTTFKRRLENRIGARLRPQYRPRPQLLVCEQFYTTPSNRDFRPEPRPLLEN